MKKNYKWVNSPNHYEFFLSVRIITGNDALEKIPAELEGLNAHRPLILCTPSIKKRNFCDIFINRFPSGMEVGVFETDVPQDSDFNRILELVKSYRDNNCDSIIVIGGGSYLDTAKGVNILVSENSNDLKKYSGSYIFKKRLNPLIAVPTTSGTGSEVTAISVIADKEKNVKHLFLSPMLLPDIAIIDSRMTETLPAGLTALTGMDALSHAVESYYGLAQNPISCRFAWNAVQKIFQYLEEAVNNPTNMEARLELAIASNLAGIAFTNSMVSMVHSLGHVVGALTHIPHANCMAILLPYGLEYNLHKCTPAIGDLLYAVRPNSPIRNDEEAALAFIQEVRHLIDRLSNATNGALARNFSEMKNKEGEVMMKEIQIPEIAIKSQNDGSIIYNPEKLSIPEAQMVLDVAWTGTPLDRSRIKKGHQP